MKNAFAFALIGLLSFNSSLLADDCFDSFKESSAHFQAAKKVFDSSLDRALEGVELAREGNYVVACQLFLSCAVDFEDAEEKYLLTGLLYGETGAICQDNNSNIAYKNQAIAYRNANVAITNASKCEHNSNITCNKTTGKIDSTFQTLK